jgi:hypothetical protein
MASNGLVLDTYDVMLGLELSDLAADACVATDPCGGRLVAGLQ